ncbi:hypothetical protein CKO28_01135 [Rhodovibrio sodomensis]|uniref:Uncharacterized protein n=2 Tax=Rhodovibrio sodomensis TaxID=1088 RepID=A0ABS1D945_9PROT|nr:hypothetical protein [Rhodovibrio sodomensis]
MPARRDIQTVQFRMQMSRLILAEVYSQPLHFDLVLIGPEVLSIGAREAGSRTIGHSDGRTFRSYAACAQEVRPVGDFEQALDARGWERGFYERILLPVAVPETPQKVGMILGGAVQGGDLTGCRLP